MTVQGTVFRYEVKKGHHELYVGDLTTALGLSLLDPAASVRITRFGATSYMNYGWATEKELPSFGCVEDLRNFLESQGSGIGLIEFEAEIDGPCHFSTHDDGECHFDFARRPALIETLMKVVPAAYEGLLINALLNNPGVYIACGESGILRKYASFEAYLEAERPTEAGQKPSLGPI